MTDRTEFDAIMTADFKSEALINECLSIISQYTTYDLKTNTKGELWYEAMIEPLLSKDITLEEIKRLRQGEWLAEGEKIKRYL